MTTITKDTPWRHLGRVPFSVWQKRITDAGGLTEAAGYDVWLACGDDSALMLEFLHAESSYSSDFDAIPASYKDPWNLQIDGKGIKFDSIADCARAWRERLYSTTYKGGIYTKTKTIYDLISTYAPRSDGNDPDGYAAKVVAGMERNGFDPPVTTPEGDTPAEPVPGEGEPMALEILNRVIGVQKNAPATLLNMGPKSAVPIIHNTSNTSVGADALMHAQFVAGGGGADNVSFHFCVDSKRAVQILPLNRIGYHASDGCDNRDKDVGCFNGIAFENCDNADGDIRKTFENQAELLACIEFGDSRIDYGGRPLSDFEGFIDRTLGHHDTAWDGKWCPEDYLNLFGDPGYKTQLKTLAKAKLAAKRGGTTPAEPPPPPPVEEVLPGLDFAVAARLFGTAKGEDNVTYKFDKNGPVSKLWLANGKQTGQWPALVSVYSYESGARRYFVFQGGATILAAKGADPRWLKEAA